MVHFQEKIAEMQRKLNKINENIEEIKNERKTMEINKKSNKNNDFLKNNIKKKNYLKNNNQSINFFNKQNVINSDFNLISNNTGKTFYQYKNSFTNNLITNNMNYIPKKGDFINHKLNLNKEQKFSNENCKNETPTFYKNNSNYKNYKININNSNITERISNNNCFNNKKMRKINSASEIDSINVIKSHKKFKQFLTEKKISYKKNINNLGKNNNYIHHRKNIIDIDYNYAYNTDERINNKNILIKSRTKNSNSLNKENQKMRNILKKGNYSCSNIMKNENKLDYSPIFSDRNDNHKIIKNKNKYEELLFDIIKITKDYNNNSDINIDNIINEYKLILNNNKIKDEFIIKIINLYNKNNKLKLDINKIESISPTWNWLKANYDYNIKNEEYKNLCLDIMKEYNLNNIEQLKIFISKMLKKINTNNYFIEGIKKILLP